MTQRFRVVIDTKDRGPLHRRLRRLMYTKERLSEREAKNFTFNFLHDRASQKFKTTGAHTENTSNKYLSRDTIPLRKF